MKIDIETLNRYYEDGLVSKNEHPEFPLLIWNYTPKTQYERLWDDITLTCRALVTDFYGNVVAKSFDKFFNIEEESILPNESFEVYEKLDGSLITIFWFRDRFVVASRGSFFSDHAKEAQVLLNEYDTNCLDKTKSYSFELIVPWNRIVCNYGFDRKLVLLAKFDADGNEYDISKYSPFFTVPKVFNFQNLSSIKNVIPKNEEGYVIKFEKGKRVKVKSEWYVNAHRLVSSVSEKFILEILSSGDTANLSCTFALLPDEVCVWAEETKTKFENRFNQILCECKNSFKSFPSRKESAAYFNTQNYPHLLFAMLDNQSIDDMIWKIIRSEIKSEL